MNISAVRILGGTAVALAATAFILLIDKNRRLERVLEQTQSELRAAGRPAPTLPFRTLPAETAHAGGEPSPTKRMGENTPSWLTFLHDPGQRAVQFEQAVVDIERDYGRFIQQVSDWPTERQEALKRQLAFNRLSLIQALYPPHFPPTKREEKGQGEKLARAREDADRKLRQLLGPAEYEKFDRFEMARGYTGPVGEITNAMRAKGVLVNERTEEVILNGYAAAMRATADSVKGVDPTPLTEGQRAELRTQQHHEIQKQLLRQLSGVLDENQLDLFLQSHLEQHGGG